MDPEEMVFADVRVVVEVAGREHGRDDLAPTARVGRALEDPAHEPPAGAVVGERLDGERVVEPADEERAALLRPEVVAAQAALARRGAAEEVPLEERRHRRRAVGLALARLPARGGAEAVAIGELEAAVAVLDRVARDLPVAGNGAAEVVPGEGGEAGGDRLGGHAAKSSTTPPRSVKGASRKAASDGRRSQRGAGLPIAGRFHRA